MKNVLLIGIGGVYNYGCEAIVRGTYKILKENYPDVNVSYASYNYNDDIQRLNDLDIDIIERKHPSRWSIQNIIRKCFSLIGIKYDLPFDNPYDFKEYDTVFSIGGDMYTLNHDGSFNKSLPLFFERIQQNGSKYILWGCSVGPFEKNPQALKFFMRHLQKADLIVARESSTINYLKSIDIKKNVKFAPDPAFMVNGNPIEKKRNSKLRIGINLSPLSVLYEYGDLERGLNIHKNLIIWLIKLYNADIILLPHVLSISEKDNDLYYLKKIYESLPETCKERVSIVETDPGFIGLKSYINRCDVIIAARMHCAVNSIETGIPCLFVSYSPKAKGMSEYVYGETNYVVSLKNLENKEIVKEKIDSLLNTKLNIDAIRTYNYKNILDEN